MRIGYFRSSLQARTDGYGNLVHFHTIFDEAGNVIALPDAPGKIGSALFMDETAKGIPAKMR